MSSSFQLRRVALDLLAAAVGRVNLQHAFDRESQLSDARLAIHPLGLAGNTVELHEQEPTHCHWARSPFCGSAHHDYWSRKEALVQAKQLRYIKIGGRVFLVVGVVVDGIQLGGVTHQSIEQKSVKPIAAQTVRTGGSWGGAWLGAKLGIAAGAMAGVETGPGMVLTAIASALVATSPPILPRASEQARNAGASISSSLPHIEVASQSRNIVSSRVLYRSAAPWHRDRRAAPRGPRGPTT